MTQRTIVDHPQQRPAAATSTRPGAPASFQRQQQQQDEGAAAGGSGSGGLAFSSRKCPPAIGPEHRCELPFGFAWTPLADAAAAAVGESSATTTAQQPDLPPVVCATCLSYMNLYCDTSRSSSNAKTWICPFCKCENGMPAISDSTNNNDDDSAAAILANRVLVSPTLVFRQPLLPHSSSSSSSSNNNHDGGDRLTIVLVLDTNLPAAEAHGVGRALQNCLRQPKDSSNSNKTSIQLGLILFGKNVSVYQLGVASGMASCDTIRSHEGLTAERLRERAYLTDHHDSSSANHHHPHSSSSGGGGVDAVLNCIAAQFGVDSSADNSSSHSDDDNNNNNYTTTTADPSSAPTDASSSTKKSRLQILKERKEARLRAKERQQERQSQRNGGSENASTPNQQQQHHHHHIPTSRWTAARPASSSPPQYRCTGEALQCALDLASAHGGGTAAVSRTARVLLFTDGCPSLGDGSVVATAADDDSDGDDGESNRAAGGGGKHRGRRRATVDTVKLARASEYFEVVAKAAAESGIGVDVFCAGHSELALPVYQALVEPSSGYVLSHGSFATPHLRRHLRFVLDRTHLSLAQFAAPEYGGDDEEASEEKNHEGDEENNNPVTASSSPAPPKPEGVWVEGCTVDIRMSSFLNPTHLIGPGDLMPSPDAPLVNEESAFEEVVKLTEENVHSQQRQRTVPSLEMLESSLTRIRLGRFDPLSTFSVMLRLNDFFQHDEFAYFQGVVRYVDRDGKFLVTRVTTQRLSVAKDVGEFLEAVDEEVVPVLLAKEAVYRSMFGRDVVEEHPFLAPHAGQLDDLAYDAQQDLDNTIFRISGAFRLLSLEHGTRSIDLTEEGGIKAAGSSMDFAFPPELSDALRRLYHLRRGPFLSPGPLQSMDDRAELRSMFVRLPLEDCLGMMAPALWSSGPLDEALARKGPLLEDVPPETLSLWENRIIAADHSHTLFVWSGSATLAPEYDEIREQLKQFLLERSEGRFPMPNLHMLTETDSMSRRFTALLAPAHGDPVEHQLAHFPALAQLSTEEQTKLTSRFRFYDPESDPSFRKWFWEVASAASASREEGISLCD